MTIIDLFLAPGRWWTARARAANDRRESLLAQGLCECGRPIEGLDKEPDATECYDCWSHRVGTC
jgi:hypothetical protein